MWRRREEGRRRKEGGLERKMEGRDKIKVAT
jgi:hypothetical protein